MSFVWVMLVMWGLEGGLPSPTAARPLHSPFAQFEFFSVDPYWDFDCSKVRNIRWNLDKVKLNKAWTR
jgi:hypothetical protein